MPAVNYIFHGNTSSVDAAFRGVNLGMTGLGIVAAKIGGALADMFMAPVKQSMEFNSAIATAAAVTSKMGQSATALRGDLGDLARQLGEETIFSVHDAADALVALGRRGIDTVAAGFTGLKPVLDLAVATNGDLEQTAGDVASALNAFGLQFDSAGRFADVFTATVNNSALTVEDWGTIIQFAGTNSKKAGLEIEELAGFMAVLTNSGVKASMAGTAFSRILDDLLSPSKKFRKELERLNLTVEDVDPRIHGMTGVLQNLDKAGFDPVTEAAEIFGKRGGRVFRVMGTEAFNLERKMVPTSQAVKEFIDTVSGIEGLSSTVAKAMENDLGRQVTKLAGKWDSAMVQIGDTNSEVWMEFVMILNDRVMPAIKEFIELHPDLVAGLHLAGGAVGFLAEGLGKLLIPLGLIGFSMKGIAVGFAAAGITAVSLGTAIGWLAAAALVAWTAWQGYQWGEHLRDEFDIMDGVFDQAAEWWEGYAVETEEASERAEESFKKISGDFSDSAEAMREARKRFNFGEEEAAREWLELWEETRSREIKGRLSQLQEERKILQARLDNMFWFQTRRLEETDKELAHIDGLIAKHLKALKNMEDESYRQRLMDQWDQWDKEGEVRKISLEKMFDMMRAAKEKELTEQEEKNELFEQLLDRHSDFWKEHVDKLGNVVWKEYEFNLESLTEAELTALGKILNEDEISMEKIHNLWTRHNDRLEKEFEKEAKEAEKRQKMWERHHKKVKKFLNDQIDSWVEHESESDASFKRQVELIKEYAAAQQQYVAAIALGWTEMAESAKRRFSDVTKAMEEEFGKQEAVQSRNITFTQTINDQTRSLYKLLAAAAQETLIDEIVGGIWIPFAFEMGELADVWDSLTKRQRDKILQYYDDLAKGIAASTSDIQDILDKMVGNSWYVDLMDKMGDVTTKAASKIVDAWSEIPAGLDRAALGIKNSLTGVSSVISKTGLPQIDPGFILDEIAPWRPGGTERPRDFAPVAGTPIGGSGPGGLGGPGDGFGLGGPGLGGVLGGPGDALRRAITDTVSGSVQDAIDTVTKEVEEGSPFSGARAVDPGSILEEISPWRPGGQGPSRRNFDPSAGMGMMGVGLGGVVGGGGERLTQQMLNELKGLAGLQEQLVTLQQRRGPVEHVTIETVDNAAAIESVVESVASRTTEASQLKKVRTG